MFIALLMSTIQTEEQLAKMFSTRDFAIKILELSGITVKFYSSHTTSSSAVEPVKHYSVAEFEELLMQEESKSQRLS